MNISKIVALALWCGALSFSSTAFAAPDGDGAHRGWVERLCAKASDSGRQERHLARLAERLHLTDAQKALFKAVQDARATARKPAIEAICANKPDLQSFEGKLAFRQRLLESRLDGMKASSAKLVAFYTSLDNGQKAVFDEMRRQRRQRWGQRRGGWGEQGRQDWSDRRRSRDD